MKLDIHRDLMRIIPETESVHETGPNLRDMRDMVFIEEVLGLKKDGESIQFERKNTGLEIYLESKKLEK